MKFIKNKGKKLNCGIIIKAIIIKNIKYILNNLY